MTVENAMSKCYRKIVRFQLEPVWHQVNRISIIPVHIGDIFFRLVDCPWLLIIELLVNLAEWKNKTTGFRFGHTSHSTGVSDPVWLRHVQCRGYVSAHHGKGVAHVRMDADGCGWDSIFNVQSTRLRHFKGWTWYCSLGNVHRNVELVGMHWGAVARLMLFYF